MEEIINSVMQSPENTNPNVLRGQLQKIDSGDIVVITFDSTTGQASKTASEILDLYNAGAIVVLDELVTDTTKLRYYLAIAGKYICTFTLQRLQRDSSTTPATPLY